MRNITQTTFCTGARFRTCEILQHYSNRPPLCGINCPLCTRYAFTDNIHAVEDVFVIFVKCQVKIHCVQTEPIVGCPWYA